MEQESLEGLSPSSKNQLHDAGWWAKVVGIVGFISSGIMAIASIFIMIGGPFLDTLLQQGKDEESPLGNTGIFMGLIYLFMAAFYFFMSWWVFRFGSEIRFGLKSNSTEAVDSSFHNLKNYFQAFGILMLLCVGILLIGVFTILAVSFFN